CVSVFREELTNLFPNALNAMRLQKQSYTLAEFLVEHAPDFEIPQLKRKAVVHGHCHHKAIMTLNAEQKLLDRLGLEYTLLDSGCCGMAGAFGYEKGAHYDVSMQCGERVLLPAVREASKDTLIITDGFSCREQILQTTDRGALHLAQVLQMALRQDEQPTGAYPERSVPTSQDAAAQQAAALRSAALVGGAALLTAGVVAWAVKRSRSRRK
ncbi:MAG TPA: FAD-binding oxidoreductase, partial [Armatimonadota bacterium]|nr:FAD-binding oxidoreductase [Armatimonadota bacterium]